MIRSWRESSSTSAALKAWAVLFIICCAYLRFDIDSKIVKRIPSDETQRGMENCRKSTSSMNMNDDRNSSNNSLPGLNDSILHSSTDTHSIAPGELPGYTGWGRPEHTLAKFFSILKTTMVPSSSPSSTTTPSSDTDSNNNNRQDLVITVQCDGHDDCLKDSSMFFLRAYGPSVIPGTIVRHGNGLYDAIFRIYDPGMYTVEVVLTFSTSTPIERFPLATQPGVDISEAYEGFLLPGFPLIVTVPNDMDVSRNPVVRNVENPPKLCTFDDLVEHSTTTALSKARWKVTGRSNGQGHQTSFLNGPPTLMGYKTGVNSLGITMEYQYLDSVANCTLLPESAFSRKLNNLRVFGHCNRKIQIIYIGDSVLRVQKDMLRALLNRATNLEFSFLSLHGGYRRNQILGPSNVEQFLQDIQTQYPDDAKVILFNTGLHDIHQLCGPEFAEDRRQYLDLGKLDSGSFSCLEEYRVLLTEFVDLIQNFPADLKVFQSTTAAWPKYGNWGIEWEHHPQAMPLTSDFCAAFNDVAYDVIASNSKNDGIDIMDGYWITYPRPDNREVGTIGKKLSHPGYEVLSTMARIWSMLILERVC